MPCPHCRSTATTRRKDRTALGYPRFNCRACKRRFNQRTGTPFNDLQYPTDVVTLAVLWRLRYELSFCDVAELLLQRGFEVTTRQSVRGSSASRPCLPTNSAVSGAGGRAFLSTSTRRT